MVTTTKTIQNPREWLYTDRNRIIEAVVSDEYLIVTMRDGRLIYAPLDWFDFLLKATPEQRANFRLLDYLIHWDDLDDGVSIEPLLLGNPHFR